MAAIKKKILLVQRHNFTRCRDKRGIKFFACKTLDKKATYPLISNNMPHGGEVLVKKLTFNSTLIIEIEYVCHLEMIRISPFFPAFFFVSFCYRLSVFVPIGNLTYFRRG